MLKALDAKVTPSAMQVILAIEQNDLLEEILERMEKTEPVGHFRPFQVTVTTTPQMYFIGYSQAFINDGTADVYILEHPMAPKSDDAPLKSTDPPLEVRPGQRRGENGGLGILRWLVTSSGTATLRIFALE